MLGTSPSARFAMEADFRFADAIATEKAERK
jgi:hypothetical protein